MQKFLKSNIKYNIKVTFHTEIIHMAHSISYGAFVLMVF